MPLGIAAAVRRDGCVDHMARFLCLIGVSAPTFWLAFIVLALFYGGLEIAPRRAGSTWGRRATPRDRACSLSTASWRGSGRPSGTPSRISILPAVVLAAATLGIVTRTTRAAMLETLGQDYVRTARAKGVAERGIVRHHAFPNALLPILTLAGLAYAELLAGTVLTETIFSWPGLGRYTYQSALAIDFPAIMGVTFLVALMYLVINLLVDIAYLLVDPRVARR